MTELPPLLALDPLGTFVFGLNGALTGVRFVRLDIVGVLTLGVITALGGGIIRDVLIGAIPPATFFSPGGARPTSSWATRRWPARSRRPDPCRRGEGRRDDCC